jgi:transcriptional regulator with XRE-family HTH domain
MASLRAALRSRRLALGLTQEEVARRARISQTLVSLLESGQFANPTLDVLRRLAKALRTSVGALFVGERSSTR